MSATAVVSAAVGTRIASNRRIAITVGILFFFQLITFMIGSSLIERYLNGEADRATLTIGVALEMSSGIAVVAIGILMYQVLRIVDKRLALGYPMMRIVEFTVSAILAIYLLAQLDEFPNRLLWVYIPTGIGGLILNYLLFKARLIPRAIWALGLVPFHTITMM